MVYFRFFQDSGQLTQYYWFLLTWIEQKYSLRFHIRKQRERMPEHCRRLLTIPKQKQMTRASAINRISLKDCFENYIEQHLSGWYADSSLLCLLLSTSWLSQTISSTFFVSIGCPHELSYPIICAHLDCCHAII